MNRVIISSGNEHDSIINQDTNDWCNDAVVNTLKPAFWGFHSLLYSSIWGPLFAIWSSRTSLIGYDSTIFLQISIWVHRFLQISHLEGLLHASFC
ncbi:unnamed protein product [Lactuca virosa]|uniref:Uncharacterized protein n=1 Tax=Lactuca virosa TaxID=75947 RepID=A0AAU9MFK3_9ASTR|nr:unnamed protein product [Lactuca virosa]